MCGDRVGVCLEILTSLNKRSFEMGFAVMHTTGQGFMMAFQAGGPHAQDRGLEAVACAWREMTRCPSQATWSKRVSKTDTVTLDKTYPNRSTWCGRQHRLFYFPDVEWISRSLRKSGNG